MQVTIISVASAISALFVCVLLCVLIVLARKCFCPQTVAPEQAPPQGPIAAAAMSQPLPPVVQALDPGAAASGMTRSNALLSPGGSPGGAVAAWSAPAGQTYGGQEGKRAALPMHLARG
jgi:hypothetical protein